MKKILATLMIILVFPMIIYAGQASTVNSRISDPDDVAGKQFVDSVEILFLKAAIAEYRAVSHTGNWEDKSKFIARVIRGTINKYHLARTVATEPAIWAILSASNMPTDGDILTACESLIEVGGFAASDQNK